MGNRPIGLIIGVTLDTDMDKDIITKARQHISEVLTEQLPGSMHYHNLDHTLEVVDALSELTKDSTITEQERLTLQLAALFHDVGYVQSCANHETYSAEAAEQWMSSQKSFGAPTITEVKALIEATRMGVEPLSQLQKYIKDADTYHLASNRYLEYNNLLKRELEETNVVGEVTSDQEWIKRNIEFLRQHRYYTEAAQELFADKKKANLHLLEQMADTLDHSGRSSTKKRRKKAKKKKKKKKKGISGSKTANTQFKTALRNHIDLSAIADNKANMMLSVNALILTISIPAIGVQLADRPRLLIPFACLIVTCLLSIIFATLATKPIKMKGSTGRNQLEQGKANLFFFGNFFRMDKQDYFEGIKMILDKKDRLDKAIMTDFFDLGTALGGKYRYLRICYSTFMYGLIATTVSFLVVLMTYML